MADPMKKAKLWDVMMRTDPSPNAPAFPISSKSKLLQRSSSNKSQTSTTKEKGWDGKTTDAMKNYVEYVPAEVFPRTERAGGTPYEVLRSTFTCAMSPTKESGDKDADGSGKPEPAKPRSASKAPRPDEGKVPNAVVHLGGRVVHHSPRRAPESPGAPPAWQHVTGKEASPLAWVDPPSTDESYKQQCLIEKLQRENKEWKQVSNMKQRIITDMSKFTVTVRENTLKHKALLLWARFASRQLLVKLRQKYRILKINAKGNPKLEGESPGTASTSPKKKRPDDAEESEEAEEEGEEGEEDEDEEEGEEGGDPGARLRRSSSVNTKWKGKKTSEIFRTSVTFVDEYYDPREHAHPPPIQIPSYRFSSADQQEEAVSRLCSPTVATTMKKSELSTRQRLEEQKRRASMFMANRPRQVTPTGITRLRSMSSGCNVMVHTSEAFDKLLRRVKYKAVPARGEDHPADAPSPDTWPQGAGAAEAAAEAQAEARAGAPAKVEAAAKVEVAEAGIQYEPNLAMQSSILSGQGKLREDDAGGARPRGDPSAAAASSSAAWGSTPNGGVKGSTSRSTIAATAAAADMNMLQEVLSGGGLDIDDIGRGGGGGAGAAGPPPAAASAPALASSPPPDRATAGLSFAAAAFGSMGRHRASSSSADAAAPADHRDAQSVMSVSESNGSERAADVGAGREGVGGGAVAGSPSRAPVEALDSRSPLKATEDMPKFTSARERVQWQMKQRMKARKDGGVAAQ